MYTHTQTHIDNMEYYSAIKKNEIPFATTWMDLEIITLSEVSQRQMYYITCGILKKKGPK